MFDMKLLEILACPQCKKKLDYHSDEEKLVCKSCGLKYRIEDDIPVLIIDEAEKF
ncbi:MAG: tetraacyldisaccharide 4'-kinase [candidate division Zixibacteria bacterium SM23_73_2]|nr:MAG: tetraacyldisaccharide 4'-kinase [candidate division Zixibacteria bacterium SM23_73_2]